uniref:Uncharacterized protein n=1 Tax=viral metagenome TaxID=1070528 RepID=A0A6C0L8F9_9ZZZZ
MEQHDIVLMSSALCSLNSLPQKNQSSEYKTIIESIKKYLNENCEHCVIEDDVDTGPETSNKIFYCEICYLTFPPSNIKSK